MFFVAYFIRLVLTQFFVMQTGAEKTRDALTQVLDNLPDAVLMLDSEKLEYCNQPADSFFGVNLSNLTSNEENR
jgi:nitrogen-specific signal transduction histidine kinase